MASWIAINTVRLTYNRQSIVIREGDVINDTAYNISTLQAAGLQLVPATDTAAAAMQAFSQVQARRGNRDDSRRDQPWWGPYMRKGQITISAANTTGTLAFTGAEADTNYFVAYSVSASTGNAAAGAYQVANVTKNTANVVLTLLAAPAGTNSITFDVMIVR